MSVGNRLREGLRLRAMSIRAFQREMMKKGVVGSSYPTIHRYLANETAPSIEFLGEAAKVLQVRHAWLATGEGTPTKKIDLGAVVREAARKWQRGDEGEVGVGLDPGVAVESDKPAEAAAAGLALVSYLDELGDRIARATLQTPFTDLIQEVDFCFRSFLARYYSTRDAEDFWIFYPDIESDEEGRALPSVDQIREFIEHHFRAAAMCRNFGYGEFAAAVLAQLGVLYQTYFSRDAIILGTAATEPTPVPRP